MQYKIYNKSLDFINVSRILHSKNIIDGQLDFVEQGDILLVIYTLTQSIRTNTLITMHLSRI